MQLGTTAKKLDELGIRTLGVVATNAERARLFFRYRPSRIPVGADPELSTHRAYGLPRSELTPELWQAIESAVADRVGEMKLQLPRPVAETFAALDRMDGFTQTDSDGAEFERHQAQLIGQFLVDRDGIIRWTNVECAREGLAGLDKFPTDEELFGAARAL